MNKSILRSKTFWVNLVLAVLPLFGAKEWYQANPELVASIWGGINILLRAITKDKVYLISDKAQ